MSRRRIVQQRSMAAEARRLLANDLDAIADGLLLARENRDAGLHEARKAIKKARALMKLLRFADAELEGTDKKTLRIRFTQVNGRLLPERHIVFFAST